MTDVVVCCGVGGVGKTTTAAAIALGEALRGRRVVVITIDPARRLADALGLATLGNHPTEVVLPASAAPAGRLAAMMLDRVATWDDLVRHHAASPEVAERLLGNPYYRALSTRLSGGHEYMATEKLWQLATSGAWDLVVVDTPPAQHVADFFEAPERIRRLLDKAWLQALFRPSTGLVGAATRRVVGVVRRLAGERVIHDLEGFFGLVGGISERLAAHGAEVDALLRDPRCRYVFVSSALAPREDDLAELARVLEPLHQRVHAVVLNRTEPPGRASLQALEAAIPTHPPDGVGEAVWAQTVSALQATARRHARRTEADAATQRRLSARVGAPVWPVPEMPAGVGTLDALAQVARALPSLA